MIQSWKMLTTLKHYMNVTNIFGGEGLLKTKNKMILINTRCIYLVCAIQNGYAPSNNEKLVNHLCSAAMY